MKKPLPIPILDKYIARNVIATILLISLALLGLDLFFTLVNELKSVGRGNYTLSAMLTFLALTAPTRLYAMFPWAALLGTLISLGMLATHRELVVMRTSSISVMRICYSVIKAAVVLIIFVVILGEGIAPFTDRIARNKKTLETSGGQAIDTMYGLWVRQGRDFIYIRTLPSSTELAGITRYEFNPDRSLKMISFAKHAVKEKEGWRLTDIKGTQFEQTKTRTFELKEQLIPNLLDSVVLETSQMKHPERLSLPTLWRIIRHRIKNELDAKNYQLAFWNKVFQPILILLMVILAVPFVFGPLRSVSMGFRIVAGIFVAYLFNTVTTLFAPLAMVYRIPPFIAVLIPMLLFAALAYFLLKRVK